MQLSETTQALSGLDNSDVQYCRGLVRENCINCAIKLQLVQVLRTEAQLWCRGRTGAVSVQ